VKVLWLGCFLLAASVSASGEDAKELEKRVTEFTLANGLRFVVMERHQAPLISFHTYVAAGSVNDPTGQTGLVNLLGHLAFKGTESVGSRNWAEEKKALEAVDEAYERMEAERNKGSRMKQEQYDLLRSQWRLAVDAAQRLSNSGEYAKILEDNGASAVRSGSNWTALQAGYTLPSNRLELWFTMESQRLMHPVIREFDKERENLIEERAKAQNDAQLRVIDTLLGAAFITHPFRVPMAGWPGDLAELKRSEARAFLERYYVPGNIVLSMVGDVDPAEAKRLAEKYFGPMPARPMPPMLRTVEPPQAGPRTIELDIPAQIMAAIAYKRPGYTDKDDAALDILHSIIGTGTSGLAWRELVQEKKVAAAMQIRASYPDGLYPNLFLFFVAPARGVSIEQLQKALDEMLWRLRTQKVGVDALSDAKAQYQAQAYERLTSNSTLAEMLAIHTAVFGDWKTLYAQIEDISKITEDDVLRVAQRYLIPANRTTVFTAIPGLPASTSRTGGLP
jgi:predicted Zn-dependent peptidase